MQRVMVCVVAKWAVCCWVVGRVYFVKVGHEERGFVCPELGKFASGRVG